VFAGFPIDVCSRSLPIEFAGDPGTAEPSVINCCTSTTTTLYPCVEGQLLIVNNTNNTVEDIYATAWLVGIATPVFPYSSMPGVHNGTSNTISVDILYSESGCISMYINTVLIQTIPFYWSDTYTFDPVAISSEDCVWFIIDNTCVYL
jgi:hypothetical protein